MLVLRITTSNCNDQQYLEYLDPSSCPMLLVLLVDCSPRYVAHVLLVLKITLWGWSPKRGWEFFLFFFVNAFA